MASYKQSCIHCNTLIERDSHFCPKCGSMSPFGYQCPACSRPIAKDAIVCSGCGRQLYVACPICHERTFVQENCESCGASLMIVCANTRCGQMQFFENDKCTACGKKIKKK